MNRNNRNNPNNIYRWAIIETEADCRSIRDQIFELLRDEMEMEMNQINLIINGLMTRRGRNILQTEDHRFNDLNYLRSLVQLRETLVDYRITLLRSIENYQNKENVIPHSDNRDDEDLGRTRMIEPFSEIDYNRLR